MFSKKFFLLLIIFSFVLLPAISIAAYGLEETADKAGLKQTGPEELPTLIGSVLGTGLSLVGVLFFALMLYGGLTWMLARGNSEQESKALDTITAAIIGIIIVLASYAITNFVFKSVGPGGGGEKPPVAPPSSGCSLNADELNGYCGAIGDAGDPTKLTGCAGEILSDGGEDISVCLWASGNCGGNKSEIEGYCQSIADETNCKGASDGFGAEFCKWTK